MFFLSLNFTVHFPDLGGYLVFIKFLITFLSTNRNQQVGSNHLSPPSMNNSLPEDSPGAMGMPRSITSSPVPPSVQSTAWMSCRRMIYIKSSPPSGHWPVPESFWPDPSMQTLVRILLQNST